VDPLLIAAGAGIFAGTVLQSATGIGFSLTAAPLVFAAIDPAPAVGLLILLGTEVNLLTLLTERRRPRPLQGATPVLLAAAAPGALAGVVILRALPPIGLQIAVTLGVVATVVVRRARAFHLPATVAGFAAGALTTSTTTAGPPLLLYLMDRGHEPGEIRDTLTVVFLGLSVLGALALLVTGTPALPKASLIAGFVPTVVVAHLVGRRVFARLAAGGRYEPVLNVVLVFAVLLGLVGVLA
jgi:uncharacterized membrane protein YfcA